MSGQLPPKTGVDHPLTDGRLNDEQIAREVDHASGEAPFQVSLLHIDSPESSARMRRALRLILRRRSRQEES